MSHIGEKRESLEGIRVTDGWSHLRLKSLFFSEKLGISFLKEFGSLFIPKSNSNAFPRSDSSCHESSSAEYPFHQIRC